MIWTLHSCLTHSQFAVTTPLIVRRASGNGLRPSTRPIILIYQHHDSGTFFRELPSHTDGIDWSVDNDMSPITEMSKPEVIRTTITATRLTRGLQVIGKCLQIKLPLHIVLIQEWGRGLMTLVIRWMFGLCWFIVVSGVSTQVWPGVTQGFLCCKYCDKTYHDKQPFEVGKHNVPFLSLAPSGSQAIKL